MTAPTGSREELRAVIAEALVNTVVRLNHPIDHADLGDDTALNYDLRTAYAHFKAALATMRDLHEKEKVHA